MRIPYFLRPFSYKKGDFKKFLFEARLWSQYFYKSLIFFFKNKEIFLEFLFETTFVKYF